MAAFLGSKDQLSSLPTWAMDLSTDKGRPWVQKQSTAVLEIHELEQSTAVHCPQGHCLHVEGILIDTIHEVHLGSAAFRLRTLAMWWGLYARWRRHPATDKDIIEFWTMLYGEPDL
jgi:hypothetical protein